VLLVAGGGQVGPETAEDLCAGHDAQAAGDLLADLDTADVLLGEVVVVMSNST